MATQLSTPELKNQILQVRDEKDICNCFAVIQELRPKLKDKEEFVDQIKRQIKQGYTLVYLRDDEDVVACMGFRIFETLCWKNILYIDDLITREKSRRKGFGKMLLEYAVEQARLQNCAELHLDSGHHRFDAHRLYLNMGFTLHCHHLSLIL